MPSNTIPKTVADLDAIQDQLYVGLIKAWQGGRHQGPITGYVVTMTEKLDVCSDPLLGEVGPEGVMGNDDMVQTMSVLLADSEAIAAGVAVTAWVVPDTAGNRRRKTIATNADRQEIMIFFLVAPKRPSLAVISMIDRAPNGLIFAPPIVKEDGGRLQGFLRHAIETIAAARAAGKLPGPARSK